MIKMNETSFEFVNMGLFDSDMPWKHPTATVPTYEIIFVTRGEMHLMEDGACYCLKKGEMLLLSPNVMHTGTQISQSGASFFWLHFYTNDCDAIGIPKHCLPDFYSFQGLLKQMLHYQETNKSLAELIFLEYFMKRCLDFDVKNKLAHDVAEFVRVGRDRALTVEAVASKFGYHADYLSRVIKNEFGIGLKELICKRRLEFVQSLLINTDMRICEVANISGFEDENSFIKFFKYHLKTTPTNYRNRFYKTHMNNK